MFFDVNLKITLDSNSDTTGEYLMQPHFAHETASWSQAEKRCLYKTIHILTLNKWKIELNSIFFNLKIG